MKRRLYYLLLCLSLVLAAGCGDDDDEASTPSVSTGAVSNVTANAATVAGEITNSGGSGITSKGFVYSNTDDEPTIDDSKVEVGGSDNTFSTTLSSLTSGSTYYVRAYATSGVGTGYGEVKQFSTGNAPPVATNVEIEGTVEVNKELSASYAYSDAENDVEEGTEIQWYVADDEGGSGEMAIEGATSETYTPADVDEFKYIRVGITAKAKTGTTDGEEVKSSFYGPVAVRTTLTFVYGESEVTYGIITSSVTGRKWLDRNLGAANTPSSYSDYANYGDLLQWGRGVDGHQTIVREDADSFSGVATTNKLSSTDSPGDALFILNPTMSPYDWRDPSNDELWQGIEGVNNPCPEGWRIPTYQEWADEDIADLMEGYSQLKITRTGHRSGDDGFFTNALVGEYWSSTLYTSPAFLAYAEEEQYATTSPRSEAKACRCIKD